MRQTSPFRPDDLRDLDTLLERADAVFSMRQVVDGERQGGAIGMRHDVDNVIEPAVEMAEWEAERGYRSTYFILHTAPYWQDKGLLVSSLDAIAAAGHEIGIHNNAIAAALMYGGDPKKILADAITELGDYGYDITGTVAHGDGLCRDQSGAVRFVNDEIFAECARGTFGPARRKVGSVQIDPFPLADLGLDYDANWIGRDKYLSDSGGAWSAPGFDETAAGFPYDGQLHMLVHPDWWTQAFVPEAQAV
jgi:hypothetical protein